MGESAPSASLLIIKNLEEGLIHQMDGLLFRETWTDWRNCTTEVPGSSRKESTEVPQVGSHNPTHKSGLESEHLESSFVKKDLEPWKAPLEK